jgi:DNA processing protein
VTSGSENAALVALLRAGSQSWTAYAELVEECGSALAILEDEEGLLARAQLEGAAQDIADWRARGMRLVTVLDPAYPENLRAVHDRPPLIFLAGELRPQDVRCVAVVGARSASRGGQVRATRISEHLVGCGYTVASGLAAGIDTAVHTGALNRNGRTIAVIGTGLSRCYPPQNGALQRRIAAECAVVSQFWPEAPPSRRSFPMRNALMSGLSLATVVIEASHTSGSRIQARLALAHGRPVFLLDELLTQAWARQLAARPGTHVVSSPAEITTVVERLASPGTLVA